MSGFDFASAYQQNAEAIQGDVLPEGEYDVEVKSAKSITTTGGKPAIRLQLAVIGGPNAGRTLPDQLTWSPESEVAMRIFRQSLEMLGATKDWVVQTGATGDQIAEKVVGARATIFAKVGEFNGQPRNNVNYKKLLAGGNGAGVGAYPQSPAPTQPPAAASVPVPSWP